MENTLTQKQAVDLALTHIYQIKVSGADCIHMSEAIKILTSLSKSFPAPPPEPEIVLEECDKTCES